MVKYQLDNLGIPPVANLGPTQQRAQERILGPTFSVHI